jgi:hypothetical protein
MKPPKPRVLRDDRIALRHLRTFLLLLAVEAASPHAVAYKKLQPLPPRPSLCVYVSNSPAKTETSLLLRPIVHAKTSDCVGRQTLSFQCSAKLEASERISRQPSAGQKSRALKPDQGSALGHEGFAAPEIEREAIAALGHEWGAGRLDSER